MQKEINSILTGALNSLKAKKAVAIDAAVKKDFEEEVAPKLAQVDEVMKVEMQELANNFNKAKAELDAKYAADAKALQEKYTQDVAITKQTCQEKKISLQESQKSYITAAVQQEYLKAEQELEKIISSND